ncbi:MAG: hypothetical protein IJ795_07075 [Bacteroidales bacterium]|nr:hypothetical protein [Bacteroidales bacterium]
MTTMIDRNAQLVYQYDAGIEEGKQEVALRMIRLQVDLETIQKYTLLSAEQIKQLAESGIPTSDENCHRYLSRI